MRAVESSRAHPSWPAFVLLALVTAAASCGSDNTSTTTPSTPAGTTTETLTGLMAPQGTATRTFTASQPGTVTVQLSKTDPALTLGLGIGISGATGASCLFTQTVNTTAGAAPQLTATVDPGSYCAGAYDLGTVGQNGVIVTVTVTHP